MATNVNEGNAACTLGLSKRIFDYWTGDARAGFSAPMSASQQDMLRALAWAAARAVAEEVEPAVDAAITAGSGGAVTAASVTSVPSGNLSANNVQAALNELQSDIDGRATSAALAAHTGAAGGAHPASAISNTPYGGISSNTVQGALNGLWDALANRAPIGSDNADYEGDIGATPRVIPSNRVEPLDFPIARAHNTGGSILIGPWEFFPSEQGLYHIDVATLINTQGVPASSCYLAIARGGEEGGLWTVLKVLSRRYAVSRELEHFQGSVDLELVPKFKHAIVFWQDSGADWFQGTDPLDTWVSFHRVS